MQDQGALFDAAPVQPADPAPWRVLAARLPPNLRLGTSSWSFPGWRGLVWRGAHTPAQLARHGLAAYAQHPLLRAVSLDRSFWRAPAARDYAALAAQAPQDFRFVVKAPAAVTDAMRRDATSGRATAPNPSFLDPALARATFVEPAVEGLGARIGALVFQLSPLPALAPVDIARLCERLAALLEAARAAAPATVVAVEVRDAELLVPAFADVLRRHRAAYCVGLHDRLPPLAAQLPLLRALWPAPLVVRWNLQRGLRYAAAKARFDPFDRLAAPDPATRDELARLATAAALAGQDVLVTINNKAEGSAPLSVVALAEAIVARLDAGANDVR